MKKSKPSHKLVSPGGIFRTVSNNLINLIINGRLMALCDAFKLRLKEQAEVQGLLTDVKQVVEGFDQI